MLQPVLDATNLNAMMQVLAICRHVLSKGGVVKVKDHSEVVIENGKDGDDLKKRLL